MRYKTIVEHDQSGIEMVQNAVDNLLEERFIEGIRTKHHTIDEIFETTEMVCMYQHRMNVEARRLTKFSKNFIRQYATDNNQCFSTGDVLFQKLRSTMKSLKELFHKTSKIDRRQLPEGVSAPSVFEKSPMAKGDYSPDVFGIESFPKPVKNLYFAIDQLFNTANSMLILCGEMIKAEEETRNDIDRVRQIYKESCEEMMAAVKAATAFIAPSQDFPENAMEKQRERIGVKNEDEFLKRAYHNYNKEVMTQFLIIRALREARNDGLVGREPDFWYNNHSKALMVRKVIENFDTISCAEGQKGKLCSDTVVEFLKWCDVPEEKESELYKKHFIPNYQKYGKLKELGWNTISGQRKYLKDQGETNQSLAAKFERYIGHILTDEVMKEINKATKQN
ncbi:MAG: hypothetical protein IKP48_01105 [Bacteroidaceae bacterium]|nr:hypothetical protein [Bacteroidaceae bacterium]